MRAAYDLSLRRSPRKRRPAGPGDALSGACLALPGYVPQSGASIAGKWPAHPRPGDKGTATDRRDQGTARLSSHARWIKHGAALQAVGRYGEARTAFREALRQAPQDVGTTLSLAHLEMECGRYQCAYDLLRIVLDRSPQLVEARVHAARACHELGKKKDARLLVEGWPDWALEDDIAAELVALLIQAGKVRDGLSLLKGISDLSRAGARTLACLASSLAHAGRLKKARHCLALLALPENIRNPALREDVLTAYASVALCGGNLSGARRFLDFLETSPSPGTCRGAQPYFMLAEICFQLFEMEAAKKALITGQYIRMKETGIASPLMIGLSRYVEETPCSAMIETSIPSLKCPQKSGCLPDSALDRMRGPA